MNINFSYIVILSNFSSFGHSGSFKTLRRIRHCSLVSILFSNLSLSLYYHQRNFLLFLFEICRLGKSFSSLIILLPNQFSFPDLILYLNPNLVLKYNMQMTSFHVTCIYIWTVAPYIEILQFCQKLTYFNYLGFANG